MPQTRSAQYKRRSTCAGYVRRAESVQEQCTVGAGSCANMILVPQVAGAVAIWLAWDMGGVEE